MRVQMLDEDPAKRESEAWSAEKPFNFTLFVISPK